MFTTRHIRRFTALGALTCALLGSAMGGVAAAQSTEESRALQQERYYMGTTGPDSHPQEEYLRSYGQPEPIAAAQAPAPSGDSTPWLPIALSVAAGFAIAAVGAAQRHRLRIRRRSAHATT